MRKNFGSKPYSYPQNVFIVAAYGENDIPNAMNAAWGGISDDEEIMLCLSSTHKTVANICERKAFTVGIGDADHVKECDYLGVVSGNDVDDKLEKAGFTVTKSEFVDAPVINELAVALECELISYDPSNGKLFGKIVNVSADEKIITDGKVDIFKLRPIVFDPFNNTYHVIRDKVGNAFKDGLSLKD